MPTLITKIDKLPTLKTGDKIAFYASGSSYPPEERVKKACDYISKKCDLKAIYWEDCFTRLPAKRRAEIFLQALFNEEFKALWAFRGGEGTGDIIPLIDVHRKEIAKLTPKLLIGFSDITVLLLYFSQIFNWPVVHGSGVPQMVEERINDMTINVTLDLVMGRLNEIKITDLKVLNSLAKISKKIKGELTGGNLSLLHCGTKEVWELDAKNKIIIIEDVNERPHVVHRTLNHLQRISLFKDAKAIIFGNFDTKPIGETIKEQQKNKIRLENVLQEFAEACEIPVFFTSQIGHGQLNIPIVYKKESFLI